MADDQMIPDLNYDCVEQLFSYLTPLEWVDFGRVCKEWKTIATSSKDFQELTLAAYNSESSETPSFGPEDKQLEVAKCLQILDLVAPELKSMNFIISRRKRANLQKAYVDFGRFRYSMILTPEQVTLLMQTVLTQTKSVQKLQVRTFEDETRLEWERFFQTNPLEHFIFFPSSSRNSDPFFNGFISLLPCSLEKIDFNFDEHWLSDDEEQQLTQLLERMPRLSKVSFEQEAPFSVMIATEVANHAKTIMELRIRHRLYDLPDSIFEDNEENDDILALIAQLINLTKLSLTGFALSEDFCTQVVANCQSIRCLKIVHCDVSESCLQILMTLPNLNELHINPSAMKFTSEARQIRKLIIDNNYYEIETEIDDELLINAIQLMPNLSCLSFDNDFLLSGLAASSIKQIVHSRGLQIVVYSLDFTSNAKKLDIKKVCEVVRVPPSENKFEIVISSFLFGQEEEPESLQEFLEKFDSTGGVN